MYVRVRAVYDCSKVVKTFFTVLWISVLCASAAGPIAPRGQHIGTTHQCTDTQFQGIAAIMPLMSAINDTLIFFAIAYRLLMLHDESDNWSDRLKSFFGGNGMHWTARLILRTGHLY